MRARTKCSCTFLQPPYPIAMQRLATPGLPPLPRADLLRERTLLIEILQPHSIVLCEREVCALELKAAEGSVGETEVKAALRDIAFAVVRRVDLDQRGNADARVRGKSRSSL